jgi:hypothetical protein
MAKILGISGDVQTECQASPGIRKARASKQDVVGDAIPSTPNAGLEHFARHVSAHSQP